MSTYGSENEGDFEPEESGELPPDEGDDENGGEQGAAADEPDLVNRKQALAARKASRTGAGTGTGAGAPTTPAPPPPEARSALGKRKAKKKAPGGEKRRGPPPASAAIGHAAVAEINEQADALPPRAVSAEDVERMMTPVDPTQEVTQDIVERWPIVLEKLAQEGFGPEAVHIRVHAVAQGPYASAPAFLGSIDGRNVVGGGDLAPADALALYVENVYHSAQRGTIRYQFDVHYKATPRGRPRGATHICRGYMTLQPYEMMAAQRRRAEDFQRETARIVGQPASVPSVGVRGIPGPLPPNAPHYLMPSPAPPQGPSYSETLMREVFERLLRGETIGPQSIGVAAPPPMMQAPAPQAMQPPPPPPPSFEEQLEGFARVMKLVQGMAPPPAPIMNPNPVGLARAREETPAAAIVRPAEPLSAVDQLKGAFAVLRDFKKLNEEFAGLGAAAEEEDEEEPEPKEEPPFKIAEMGGYKWPHGKGLGRLDQFQQFMMLNPDVSLKMLQGLSRILDQSAIRPLLELLAQRGNPQQAAAAQQAMQQGLGAPTLPPVVRPASYPPPAAANGAAAQPAMAAPPVAPGFTAAT